MKMSSLYKRPFLFAIAVVLLPLVPSRHLLAQSKPWPVPKEYTTLTNPLAGNQAALKEGKSLYTTNCVPCHGDKGKGDGPAAAALNPKPADHSSSAMLRETDGNLFYKISEGRTPMPQYKAVLTEKQRWELVTYIRTLYKGPKQ
jgi:mono/diheme cytochrome c family protein